MCWQPVVFRMPQLAVVLGGHLQDNVRQAGCLQDKVVGRLAVFRIKWLAGWLSSG